MAQHGSHLRIPLEMVGGRPLLRKGGPISYESSFQPRSQPTPTPCLIQVSQYFVSTWRNMEAISTSIQDLFELTNRIGTAPFVHPLLQRPQTMSARDLSPDFPSRFGHEGWFLPREPG